MTGSADLGRALALDPDGASVSPEDRAMLDYAGRLTRDPASVGEADVAQLRDHGFDDAAILDICQVVAYYNYVNRLADGLGVELEDEWTDDDLTITADEFARRARRAGRGRTDGA